MRRSRLAVAVAAVAALAACSSPASPPPTPSSTSGSAPAGHGALATCLADHGVSAAPGPAGPPPGVDQDTWQKAMQACSTLEPGPAG